MKPITIGIDLAKSVFQVHGVDAAGDVVIRKKLRRAEVLKFFKALAPCLVGMEACATSHFWAREIGALGHDVRLMPPSYVKAYLRRQKNDAPSFPLRCRRLQGDASCASLQDLHLAAKLILCQGRPTKLDPADVSAAAPRGRGGE